MAEQRSSALYESSFRMTMALAERVPAERRADPGVCGSWSLKDLMGHLAFWDGDLALELDAKRAGTRLPTSSERDWETINAEQARLRADWDWEAVTDELRANHERLIPLLNDPGENSDDEPIHKHWDGHRAQIEQWLAANGYTSVSTEPGEPHETYLAIQQSTVELASELPESLRNEPGVCGNWTLTELMAHLAFWDGVVADRLSAKRSGKPWTSDPRDLDIVNSEAIAVRADLSWNDILEELESNRDRLGPLLIDPGEGDGFKIHTHWQTHRAQIEAWAAGHSHV